MADTLTKLDNTRKMSAKCLLILSVKMIFNFYVSANDRIDKLAWRVLCMRQITLTLSEAPGNCIA